MNSANVGWIRGMNEAPAPAGAQKVVTIKGDLDLVRLFGAHGWQLPAKPWPKPGEAALAPKPGQVFAVLYGAKQGDGFSLTHAALWTSDGVYAKMGQLGTFKFQNVAQMSGGAFGNPVLYLTR